MSVDSIPVPARKTQHPLRNRAFRLLWIGNTVSWTGDQFYLVALPWLVLSLTGSSVVLGSIAMLAAIPRGVLMLLGGAVSDRASPRLILVFTAFFRSLLVTAVAVLLFLRILRLWELYFLVLGFGVADAFSYPAGSALLPFILEPEQLPAGNSISQSAQTIPARVPAANADIRSPNMDAEPNSRFAISATPTVMGPASAKLRTAMSTTSERRETSAMT